MPYISASIIMQMATHVVPTLRAAAQGGRVRPPQDHAVHALRDGLLSRRSSPSAAATALQNQGVVLNPGTGFVLTAAITLVTGTMFLMWLGEQITERGIGNGISMIILASILSGLPSAIGGTLELVNTGGMRPGRCRSCSASSCSA